MYRLRKKPWNEALTSENTRVDLIVLSVNISRVLASLLCVDYRSRLTHRVILTKFCRLERLSRWKSTRENEVENGCN